MSTYKAILFDFGNVIINIDPELTLKSLSDISGKPLEKVREKMEESQLNKRYELGMFSD
jgi:glucose-1-phosphatase